MGLTDFPPVEVEERRSRRGHLSLRGWEGTGRGAPPRRARFSWEECEKEAVGPSPSTRALSSLPCPRRRIFVECVAGLPRSLTSAWVQPTGGSSTRWKGWKRGAGLGTG